mgnify:FL=1
MGLTQVATSTVSDAVSSVSILGITTDDVYMVAVSGMKSSGDITNLNIQVTKSSDNSADSSANYDYAYKKLRTGSSFDNTGVQNDTAPTLGNGGTGTGEMANYIIYCYNFNNSSKFSSFTYEPTTFDFQAELVGNTGGLVHTVTQSCNGLLFKYHAGNITTGTFTLYKVT